jgi:exonuclease VII small subunit
VTDTSKLEQTITRLQEAVTACKEATREAHQATKDLRAERQQVQQLLGPTAKELVHSKVEDLVTTEFNKLGPVLKANSRSIYDRVQQQIDMIIDLSLGKQGSTRKGHEDLRPVLASKLRDWLQVEIDRIIDEALDDVGLMEKIAEFETGL